MFSNITPQILATPLNKVDLFHLTWYWFSQNTLLSYFIGVMQILGGILLLFNRTVIIASLLLLTIFIGILLIDIYCVGFWSLIARVSLYILFIIFLLVRRKAVIFIILKLMTMQSKVQINYSIKKRVINVFLFLILLLALELTIILLSNFLFTQINSA